MSDFDPSSGRREMLRESCTSATWQHVCFVTVTCCNHCCNHRHDRGFDPSCAYLVQPHAADVVRPRSELVSPRYGPATVRVTTQHSERTSPPVTDDGMRGSHSYSASRTVAETSRRVRTNGAPARSRLHHLCRRIACGRRGGHRWSARVQACRGSTARFRSRLAVELSALLSK